MNLTKPTVPDQSSGAEKNIEHIVEAADQNDARKLFMIARNRIVDVNNWDEYSGAASATFTLTDQTGKKVNRTAEIGDYFKIDLPGPGPAEGDGYDWVKVEAIEDESNPDGENEFFSIRVRPVPDPTKKGENVAHFFSDEATSSFVLERRENKVTAAVYGRNEKPNTNTTKVIDKLRNAVVGVTAIAGLSNIQWKNLVKGLLKTS